MLSFRDVLAIQVDGFRSAFVVELSFGVLVLESFLCDVHFLCRTRH